VATAQNFLSLPVDRQNETRKLKPNRKRKHQSAKRKEKTFATWVGEG